MFPFCSDEMEVLDWDVIRGGDLIRLYHVDQMGYLAADICYNLEENPELYLRRYRGKYAEEQNSVSTIWEIEPVDQLICGNPCFQDGEDGSKAFRLRHFRTGRLLESMPVSINF